YQELYEILRCTNLQTLFLGFPTIQDKRYPTGGQIITE
ncbi:MAG: hypothetical protein ACI8RD_003714, partial [Bacillariaceae sp.]